jgi:uncharacterized delta-60 repeat protein
MKRVWGALAVVLGCVLVPAATGAAAAPGAAHPGNFDRSFATNGRFSIGGDPDSVAFSLQAVTADGSVIEAGNAQSRTPSPHVYPIVMKLTTAGVPDPNFGTDGRVNIAIDPYPSMGATAMLVDGRGRILLGIAGGQVDPTHYFSGLVRLKSDGTLDTGFGDNGRAVVDLNAAPAFIRANADATIDVVSDSGTKHISIVRFTKAGVPVSTFGSGGIVTLYPLTQQPWTYFSAADLGDGSTLLFEQVNPVVRRVLPDGSYDPAFGTSGVMELTTPIKPLAPDRKGYEVVAKNASGQSVVQRVLAGGTFDPTFGNGSGSITIANPAATVVAHHGAYFYGFVHRRAGNDIVRFTADGQADAGFGRAGSRLLAKPSGAIFYYPERVSFDPFDRIYVQQLAGFGYVDMIDIEQSDVYRLFSGSS